MSLVISLAIASCLASTTHIEINKSREFPFEETVTITSWSEDMLEEKKDEDDDGCSRN